MPVRLPAAVTVQALTLIGVGTVVALVHGPQAFAWLGLTLALSVVAAFVAGIAVGAQQGFVVALAATTSASLGFVALGAVAAALLGA